MAGLGGKFDAPASNYTSLTGLTPSQQAKVTDLRMRQIINIGRAVALLGPASPEVAFTDVLHLNVTNLVRASNFGQFVRSAVLYAIARSGQIIERLPGLYRGQNQGIPGAEMLAAELKRVAETGVDGVRDVLDLLPERSATSGLGVAPIAVAITVSVVLAVAVVALSYFLFTSQSNVEQADEFCAGRLRTTGVACDPVTYRAYIDNLPPESRDFLNNTLDKMGDAAGSAVKYALIGVGVLVLGVVGYNYFLYRTGKAVKHRGALAANRRRSSRRRRTSRKAG
jgi:hypothetical protein